MTSEEKERMRSLEKENEKLRAEVANLNERVQSLNDTLLWLRKKVFGQMSEKRLPSDPNQLCLFNDEQTVQTETADSVPEAEDASVTVSYRNKRKPVRRDLDMSGLPVKETHIYPDGTTESDGTLKDEYVEIGTEESSRIERTPSMVFVVKTVRHKLIAKSDIEGRFPEDRRILTPPAPLAPVSKSMAGASVLADIIIGKFMYYLPFYRQAQQYRESGIEIPQSTIGGWYEAAIDRLRPLYETLRRQVMSSGYIQIDESVIPVLDDERHRARKGYEWVVRDGISGDAVFLYDRGRRSLDVARGILSGYRGTVQSDGYGVYDHFENAEGITLCGCWAHARRYFFDSLDENRAMATTAISHIARLYAVEKEADENGLDTEARCRLRLEKSAPVIREFEEWMKESFTKVPPSSRTGKAIAYAYGLLPRLSRYLHDGRVKIDNNLIENQIRPLAVSRKNFLFCSNDASACRAAIALSLICTCKAAGVSPREWMEDVLRMLPYYRRDGRDISELLPRTWKNCQAAEK